MIVSASYRTDVPALYGRWFAARLSAGWAEAPSPYGGPPTRVDLAGAQAFVFWTRNAAPFRPVLEQLAGERRPFVVQYTLTGYPRAIEAAVPAAEASVGVMRALARAHGGRAVVWRYDPVLLSAATGPAWHEANFAHLAASLKGTVDEVVTSFLEPYAKTRRNLRAAGIDAVAPPEEEKRALVRRLAATAAENGMRLTLCTQPALAGAEIGPARCIDAARLSDVAGRPIAARTKGNRPGCLCAESRDVGAYDTCPQGCAYCYAVGSRARARAAARGHDAAQPRLGGHAAAPAGG
jgi:hypothetical protein